MAATAGIKSLRISVEGLAALFGVLRRRGYTLVGPTISEGAIVYAEIQGVDDLPAGWTDRQAPASYRLERREDEALFGFAVGPHSWKRYLFPPHAAVFSASRTDHGFAVAPPEVESRPMAFIGVRACELHAIQVQDRVFLGQAYGDPLYRARRESAFIVAVNCGTAGGTCFCASMGTGPRVPDGHDLALTELLDGGRHEFLVEVGSDLGADVLAEVPHELAAPADETAAAAVVAATARSMGREMQTEGIRDLLYRNLENPRWEDVAERCLSCGNCTMACPTCFCSSVEDHSDLGGDHAERERAWDSCFTSEHSYIHGGSVRPTTRSRYRQWMTHKLATWIDQFGTSGCVGCGRCITWCPVGIDITEEVAAIRITDTGQVRLGGDA